MSVMTSFNTFEGIPSTANRWLLTDVLRGMWGFKGMVVTDYTAIAEMMDHGLGDLKNVSALALNAGTDMDMMSDGYRGTLAQSIAEGKVSEAAVNAALKKLGKPIVLLTFSGRPTVMTWENDNFDAILNVWFGGCETADAICDVLFGDKCPSGKLTATMPKSVGQIPLYYNHLNTGRPLEEGK